MSSFDSSPIGVHRGDKIRAIARWLHDNPGEHRASDIADELGEARNATRAHLRRAVIYGVIDNPRYGYYVIRDGIQGTSKPEAQR